MPHFYGKFKNLKDIPRNKNFMQHSHRIYKKHTKNIISICILSINTEIKNLKKKPSIVPKT